MSRCCACNGGSGTGWMIGLGDGRWACQGCIANFGKSQLSEQRINVLIQLCHPDRHHGSKLEKIATETTQWLLSLRKGK